MSPKRSSWNVLRLADVRGSHGRTLEAAVCGGTCVGCRNDGLVLMTDGSEGEYEGVLLCLACVNRAFDSAAKTIYAATKQGR